MVYHRTKCAQLSFTQAHAEIHDGPAKFFNACTKAMVAPDVRNKNYYDFVMLWEENTWKGERLRAAEIPRKHTDGEEFSAGHRGCKIRSRFRAERCPTQNVLNWGILKLTCSSFKQMIYLIRFLNMIRELDFESTFTLLKTE